jgi:hypothetical protein
MPKLEFLKNSGFNFEKMEYWNRSIRILGNGEMKEGRQSRMAIKKLIFCGFSYIIIV